MGDPKQPALSPFIGRRRLLQAGCGLLVAARVHADETDPALAPPREDDLLVFAWGSRTGEVIAADALATGARQVQGYPMDPVTRVVRNGTRLNEIILVRLDPELLAPETRARSAAGVVAYSAVCTHTGCDVTDWHADTLRLQCPCHESEFDPKDAARVYGGPAPLPLAALPLKITDGALAVAGAFIGRVGFAQPGFDLFGQ
jgi:rieske iron-sulfur protein